MAHQEEFLLSLLAELCSALYLRGRARVDSTCTTFDGNRRSGGRALLHHTRTRTHTLARRAGARASAALSRAHLRSAPKAVATMLCHLAGRECGVAGHPATRPLPLVVGQSHPEALESRGKYLPIGTSSGNARRPVRAMHGPILYTRKDFPTCSP